MVVLMAVQNSELKAYAHLRESHERDDQSKKRKSPSILVIYSAVQRIELGTTRKKPTRQNMRGKNPNKDCLDCY